MAVLTSLLLGAAVVVAAPPAAVPWLVGFFVLGAAYSAPPLRLKTRPPLDSLSNGLYILPGAAAYAALTGTAPPLAALAGGWLWTMAMHTYSAVPDIEPDRRAGIETLATVLGRDRALAYCAVCWLLSAAAFALLDPRAGLLLLVYPALVGVIALRDVDVDRAYWWYPGVNAVVGAVFTVAGLWGVVGA
jgi:4-hydroxybenzoate polyprenyltransferase